MVSEKKLNGVELQAELFDSVTRQVRLSCSVEVAPDRNNKVELSNNTDGLKIPKPKLTFSPPADKRGERAPQWAPDGSAIFFLARRNDHAQLFRLDLRGGEAMPYDLKVMPAVD